MQRFKPRVVCKPRPPRREIAQNPPPAASPRRREIVDAKSSNRRRKIDILACADVRQSIRLSLLQFGRQRAARPAACAAFATSSLAEQCSRVGVQGIVEEPARRRIGTEVVWIGSKQRVHGAERDYVRPQRGSLPGKRDHAGSVADAASRRRCAGHRLAPRAPTSAPPVQRRDRVATGRRDRDA